jgi:hypothetical protein
LSGSAGGEQRHHGEQESNEYAPDVTEENLGRWAVVPKKACRGRGQKQPEQA